MYEPQNFDDFDSQIQPEDLMDDNPIDEDYEADFSQQFFEDNDLVDCFDREFDEGSDRDNWEEEQVFQDHEL